MKKRKLKKLVKQLRREVAELRALEGFLRPFAVGATVTVKPPAIYSRTGGSFNG